MKFVKYHTALFSLAIACDLMTCPKISFAQSIISTAEVQGQTVRIIQGGLQLERTILHQFPEFNIDQDEAIYFSPSPLIEQIITQITGNQSSAIAGKLGVIGNANLWLINPNGVVFTESAQLDIAGSFIVTTNPEALLTSQRLFLEKTGYADLLSIQPNAYFSPKIVNQGNLTIGQDLFFVAANIELLNSLATGGDIQLIASNSLNILDTLDKPLQLISQRNIIFESPQIQISTLNHSDSYFFAKENIELISENPIIADTKFYAEGSLFADSLLSPNDPILTVQGNVSFDQYTGASLHILAGGSITANSIIVNGADGIAGIDQDVMLSDGRPLQIRGKSSPTIDLRAGTTDFSFSPELGGSFPTLSETSGDRADINVKNIEVTANDGLIYLSNQYQSNNLIGDINVQKIISNPVIGNSARIILDSRNNIDVNQGQISTIVQSGQSGDIDLIANGDIAITSSLVDSKTAKNTMNVTAGNINIFAAQNIQVVSSQIESEVENNTVNSAAGDIRLVGLGTVDIRGSQVKSDVDPSSSGQTGNISIEADTLMVQQGSEISASTFGVGDSGLINILATDEIVIDGARTLVASRVGTNATGKSLGLRIQAPNVTVQSQAEVTTRTDGFGKAGGLRIDTQNLDIAGNARITSSSSSDQPAGNILLNTETTRIQDGGAISVSATGQANAGTFSLTGRSLEIRDGAIAATSTSGEGGNLRFDLSEYLLLGGNSEISTTAGQQGTAGNGGNIQLRTPFLLALPKGSNRITANAFTGNGGNVEIVTKGIFNPDFVTISASSQFGLSGTVNISDLEVDEVQSLEALQSELLDASDQISTACDTLDKNRFIAAGRGGLPPTPFHGAIDDSVWSDWRKEPLPQATEWRRSPSGEITLTACR
ncbi:filamentous hemagglutinin N-terminal domain-containing protein [[Leptolyngbya] sp. PCC 7376]|uniref:two-partner secretion domain-containing protein n=1 Tax=[Leptolyngbya] sp. PCC 7376 TaxID=111781 RepID=UPI00135790BE|nr:filamentous hemagglutinin N-terminal domain-containing protein [[Leptolyngbya] sp. PCC 7376]